jgi:hypothetical protein
MRHFLFPHQSGHHRPEGQASTLAPPEEETMSKQSHFPPGWDEARVRRVLEHYESQSDEEALAEDEAAFETTTHTAMEIPVDLVPAVRELIAKHRRSA